MNYDREEDILYLAHQLWEESGEPHASKNTCWKQAAQQIIARGRRRDHLDSAATRRSCESVFREGSFFSMARTADHGGVSFIGGTALPKAANAPRKLALTAE
jgi:hypothetical protein